MKIAIISSGFFPVIDGVTVSLNQRLRILSQLNHQVLLLCPDYQPLKAIYPNWRDHQGEIFPNVNIISLPSEPFMGVKFERNLSTQARPALQQVLEAFAPDIVHVDEPDRIFLGLLTAPGVAYAKAHNIPCIGFYHTNFIDYIEDFLPLPKPFIRCVQWLSMLFIRPVFHAYDIILTASSVTQQRLQQLKVKNTVCDRYLGVDTHTFKSQPKQSNFFQTQYGIENITDKTKLIFLGRLTPDKGWKFTLKALAAWVTQTNSHTLHNIAIVIAGDGALKSEIKATLTQLGITTHFLGRIPPSIIPALLTNSDIHITTSEKETLGLTVLEAFAAGIPVIAPNTGGVITHIRSGQNSILYSPQNVDSFNQALNSLISDPIRRTKMGKQAQKDVAEYDWEQAIENLTTTWREQISLKNNH
ncbi:MAG: glycosyltransferase [Cyanobacteria bacterium J06650_10]